MWVIILGVFIGVRFTGMGFVWVYRGRVYIVGFEYVFIMVNVLGVYR